jgi:hypothetical protein
VPEAVAPWRDPARRAPAPLRRPVVRRVREDLREQDREHDVAGGLRVRAARAGRPEGDQQERARVAGHAADLRTRG